VGRLPEIPVLMRLKQGICMEFGKMVKKRLHDLYKTQLWLCNQIDMSIGQLQFIVNGYRKDVPADVKNKIIAVLDAAEKSFCPPNVG